MAKIIFILLCSILFLGCNESSRSKPVSEPTPVVVIEDTVIQSDEIVSHRDFKDVEVVPPGSWFSTPHGTTVWIPSWLENYQDLKIAALNEIDATAVELDSNYPGIVPTGLISNPPDWRVVIMDPGAFSLRASPTGLANGYVDLRRKLIYVGWRAVSSEKRMLPALGHELGHVYAFIHSAGDFLFASLYGHGE